MSKIQSVIVTIFLVVILSHGKEGHLFSYDTQYPTHTVWENFTGDNCQTLVGKPKLFFIQVRLKTFRNREF